MSEQPPNPRRAARRIAFSEMAWTDVGSGARSRQAGTGDQRIRILEITPDLVHPEWCEKGHAGFVLEGELELRFEDEVLQYGTGDGFIIPSGPNHKHIPRALSRRTVLVMFEEAQQAAPS
jgi:quercetin dioxygenase-like cupin family protein